MREHLLVALVAVLLTGCLRVGPGEDLTLVCEEKSGSPRMAYGIELLVAQTRVNGTLSDADRLSILEAARHHVITPAGREHVGFEARLEAITPTAWRFEATGLWEGAPLDHYDVVVEIVDGTARAPPIVEAPRTIRDAAWRIMNETEDPSASAPERAAWDPTLPSCVTLAFGAREVVVNVVQARIVALP